MRRATTIHFLSASLASLAFLAIGVFSRYPELLGGATCLVFRALFRYVDLPSPWPECGQGFFVLPTNAVRTPRDPILRHVHNSLRRHLAPGGHVLVATSGGRDSIALADAVRRLGRSLRLTMTIAHVHHGLRGHDADADEAFVRGIARAWKVGYVSARVRTNAYRQRHRLGIEAAARHLRYRALGRLRRKIGADVILTAHHANDQAETVLLRALRGSHRRGLSGILPALHQPPVVRPLLSAPRSLVEEYVRRRRLPYRQDASNYDLTFRRNAIRHRLLALVGDRLQTDPIRTFPRLANASRLLGETAERIISRIERSTLHASGRAHFLNATDFGLWPDAVRNELLARFLRRAAIEPTNSRLRSLDALLKLPIGRRLPLGRSWEAFREREGLSLARVPSPPKAAVRLRPGDNLSIPGGRLHVSGPRSVPRSVKSPPERAWIDANAVRGPLTARCWKPADRIMPLGMASTRKVSDLLTDRKIPAFRKRLVPVVISGRRIVWVCGVAIDDRVKIHAGTTHVLQFSFHSNV